MSLLSLPGSSNSKEKKSNESKDSTDNNKQAINDRKKNASNNNYIYANKDQPELKDNADNEDESQSNFKINVRCDKCGMLFRTADSLRRHKEKFCIGPRNNLDRKSPMTGDEEKIENNNKNKKRFQNDFDKEADREVNDDYNDSLNHSIAISPSTRNFGTPNDRINHVNITPMQTQSAIDELKKYKNRKSMEQSIQDIQDTITRDNVRNKKIISSLDTQRSKKIDEENEEPIDNEPEEDPYKSVLDKYDEHKKNEEGLMEEINDYHPNFNLKKSDNKENQENGKTDFLSLFDTNNDNDADVDYSVDVSHIDDSKMDEQTRQNLKRIQQKTLQLEKDRRDIQLKLESIRNNKAYPVPVHYNQRVNRILIELRQQHRLNQIALNMLRQRLVDESPYFNTNLPTYNKTNPYLSPKSVLPPLYSNNEYLPGFADSSADSKLNPEEIRMMRLNYLQNGGHDHHILNKFTEMEYNARFKDPNPTRPLNGYDPVTSNLDNKIRKIDLDNKRLQLELELLQDKYQNLNNENAVAADTLRKFQNNPISIAPPLNGNPFNSNRIVLPEINPSLQSYRSPPLNYPNQDNYQPPVNHPQFNQPQFIQPQFNQPQFNQQPANLRNDFLNATPRLVKLKDLPPSPYDPSGGFVVFIDFVTNLDPAFNCGRVITCLHHPKSGLGEPATLPIVNCENYIEHGNQSSVALISTKQPVPRCPPQQALTILIELQLALKNSNETRLRSCAWTKLPLFDSKNRLLSGRWKCQLKNLPVRSDLTINALNSVPNYGYTELYYRLVNIRDSDEQTNAPISPAYADQYRPSVQNMHQHSRTQIQQMYDDQFVNENFDSDDLSSFNNQTQPFDESPRPKNNFINTNENQLKDQNRKPLRLSRENLALRNSVLDLDQQEQQNQLKQQQPQLQSNKIPTKRYQLDTSVEQPIKNNKFQRTTYVKPLKF